MSDRYLSENGGNPSQCGLRAVDRMADNVLEYRCKGEPRKMMV